MKLITAVHILCIVMTSRAAFKNGCSFSLSSTNVDCSLWTILSSLYLNLQYLQEIEKSTQSLIYLLS